MTNLKSLMNDWQKDLNRCQKDLNRCQKIESLREAVMACDTFGELSRIIDRNLEFLIGNEEVIPMFERAIKRIRGIRKEQMKSWKLQMN